MQLIAFFFITVLNTLRINIVCENLNEIWQFKLSSITSLNNTWLIRKLNLSVYSKSTSLILYKIYLEIQSYNILQRKIIRILRRIVKLSNF